MEKIIFKFAQKLHEPKYIATIFISFLFIGMAPVIRSILPKTALLIYSVLALSPIAIYFSSLGILMLITMPSVLKRIKLLANINDNTLTVKQVARRMNISVRKAFVLLELAERGGNYKRDKFKYTAVTESVKQV